MNKNFSKAEKSLIESDPKLGKVIENNGHLKFSIKKIDPFNELVNIVISQFISTKAAKGIKEKMLKQLNEESFKILSFKNLTISQIKNLGLSKNKAKSIKSLVLFFGQNPNSKNLHRLSEEERYVNLIKIFGIGKWSIEMFEMFYIRNKNIFSSEDAAIRVAMEELEMVKKTNDFEKYDEYAKRWDPYKTIACLHLWHFIES